MCGCEYCLDNTMVQRKGWFLVPAPPPPYPTPTPLFKGPNCLRGVGVKDCTWAPPVLRTN